MIDVAVVGDECGLGPSFLTGLVDQLRARHIPGVTAARFDDDAHAWCMDTSDGASHVASIVVDTRRGHQASTPNYHGCNDFDGPMVHFADWDPQFDPTGKRIAVIGNRAAHVVPTLAKATVSVFDCPPNWRVQRTRPRWLPQRAKPLQPQLVSEPIERITRTGIDTLDGTHHSADAIVFATGCTSDAYLGIAAHGSPNCFTILGPDSPVGDAGEVAGRQARYIAECLQLMREKDGTRIEVRRSVQRQFTERGRVTTAARAFEVTSHDAQSALYDGPARLTVGGGEHPVRVRLTGRLDPIDGKYHWQGTVFGTAIEIASQTVELAVDERVAEARITETTPWGGYSIAGVGTPPYATQT